MATNQLWLKRQLNEPTKLQLNVTMYYADTVLLMCGIIYVIYVLYVGECPTMDFVTMLFYFLFTLAISLLLAFFFFLILWITVLLRNSKKEEEVDTVSVISFCSKSDKNFFFSNHSVNVGNRESKNNIKWTSSSIPPVVEKKHDKKYVTVQYR